MFKKFLLTVLQLVFLSLVAWFIVSRLDELYAAVDTSLIRENPSLILLSVVLFLAFYSVLAIHWMGVCRLVDSENYEKQWLAFLASQPYKYLPSSVFTFSARASYAKKLGTTIKKSSLAQVVENGNILLGALCISIIFLAYNYSVLLGIGATLVMIFLMGAVIAIPRLKIPKTSLEVSGREWLNLFLLTLIAWVIAGGSLYFLNKAVGDNVSFVSIVAANSIAMGLGIVAIFAPGGIGIREFIYAKFSIGAPVIILWRLLTLLIDVVLGVWAIILIKNNPTSKHPK